MTSKAQGKSCHVQLRVPEVSDESDTIKRLAFMEPALTPYGLVMAHQRERPIREASAAAIARLLVSPLIMPAARGKASILAHPT